MSATIRVHAELGNSMVDDDQSYGTTPRRQVVDDRLVKLMLSG
jgi:hypothetical protein